jgi:hypothetical protein
MAGVKTDGDSCTVVWMNSKRGKLKMVFAFEPADFFVDLRDFIFERRRM